MTNRIVSGRVAAKGGGELGEPDRPDQPEHRVADRRQDLGGFPGKEGGWGGEVVDMGKTLGRPKRSLNRAKGRGYDGTLAIGRGASTPAILAASWGV